MDMTEEFRIYLKKMQDLLKDEKIQPLLKKRNSKLLIDKFQETVEEKKAKIEKIKVLIKDTNTNKNVRETTNNLIENFNKKETSNNNLMNQDIAGQEESFKKRLEEKKLFRTNSQPHMGFKSNKLKKKSEINIIDQIIEESNKKADRDAILRSEHNNNNENNFAITQKAERQELLQIGFRKKSLLSTSQSPVKRKSRIGAHEEELSSLSALKAQASENSKKDYLNLEFNSGKLRKSNQMSKNDDNIDDIFDQDYNEKIMRNLNELLENTERMMLEELEKTQNDMQKFLEELMEEKLEKTIEINKKYENELKELETDVDLNDETNVNTIIYNDIKKDRENEKKAFYEELEIRKKNGLAELKNKGLVIKNTFQNNESIKRIKENISKSIKEKISESIKPSENLNKILDYLTNENKPLKPSENIITLGYRDENDSCEEETVDDVKENDITLNKSLKKCPTEKSAFKRSVQNTKRVSKGVIGGLNFKEGLSENNKEN